LRVRASELMIPCAEGPAKTSKRKGAGRAGLRASSERIRGGEPDGATVENWIFSPEGFAGRLGLGRLFCILFGQGAGLGGAVWPWGPRGLPEGGRVGPLTRWMSGRARIDLLGRPRSQQHSRWLSFVGQNEPRAGLGKLGGEGKPAGRGPG